MSPVSLTESHTSPLTLTQIAIAIGIGTFVPYVAVFLRFSYPFDPDSDPDPDFDELLACPRAVYSVNQVLTGRSRPSPSM